MSSSERWLVDFQAAEQLGQEIMELINERKSVERSGGTPSRIQAQIRSKLQQFSKGIKQLRSGLMEESSLFTTLEAERRQNQIDALISREKQLNQAFKPSDSGIRDFNRDGLFNQAFDVERNDFSSGTSSFGAGKHDDITPDAFRQKQSQILQEQDKGLDALSNVIQRQKLMGQTIGEEIDYHNELIDDITVGVDNTRQKLIRTEKHVQKVNKKSGSCVLIIIVILLFIGIVVAAVVPK